MSDDARAAATVPFNPVRINGKTLAEYLGWSNVAEPVETEPDDDAEPRDA